MNKDKLGKSLTAASIAATVIASHAIPMMAEETKTDTSGVIEAEQVTNPTEDKKDLNENDQEIIEVTPEQTNTTESNQEETVEKSDVTVDSSKTEEEPVAIELETQAETEEKQTKATANVIPDAAGTTIQINGSQSDAAPYELTTQDMALLQDLTGKTLVINGFVQFPQNLTLNQTTISGANSGNDGIWFPNKATDGITVNGNGSKLDDIWVHGRVQVSNGALTIANEVDITGGSDTVPSIALNEGSLTWDHTVPNAFAYLYLHRGMTTEGNCTVRLSHLSFQNEGAINAIDVKSGQLTVGPMDRLELLGTQTQFGLKVADGASVMLNGCQNFIIANTSVQNFVGVQLGTGSTLNTIDSFVTITTDTGVAFSGAANSTINMESTNFKSGGTLSGGVINGSTLNFNQGNFEVIGVDGWENHPTSAPMSFTNATVTFKGNMNTGKMGLHLGANLTLTNSELETSGGSQVAEMTGINLENGAVVTVKNSELNVNGVYGASVKGNGSLVIDNDDNHAVFLDGTNNFGKNIQLPEGKFIIKNGYVFVDYNTGITYDQYIAGGADSHPGMDHNAVNANGEAIYPFVIDQDKAVGTVGTLQLQDNTSQYEYKYSVQKDTLTLPHGNRAYVWGPVATVNFFGEGTVDGTTLSTTTATPYKKLFLRGTTPSVTGNALPNASKPTEAFVGWRPQNDAAATPSKDPVLTAGENNLVAAYETGTKVTLRYVDAQGAEIKVSTTPIDVATSNPTITVDQLKAELPQYYALQNEAPITVPAADLNNPTTTINVTVVPAEWTVTLNYTDNGASVGTKNVTFRPLDGVEIPAQTVQDGVPADYALVTPGPVTVTNDKQTIDVPVKSTKPAPVEWTANIVYKTADGTAVVTQIVKVPADNPVVTAADIEKNVPNGYQLTTAAADTAITQDGGNVEVTVAPVQWTVTLNYTDNGNSVGTKPVTLTVIDGLTIDAATVQSGVPADYELVNAGPVTATSDKEVIDVPVRSTKPVPTPTTWTAMILYTTADGSLVGSCSVTVLSNDPVITAADIEKFVPVGYELATAATDATITQNGESVKVTVVKKADAPAIITVNLQFKDQATGQVIASIAVELSSDKPIITKEQIVALLPAGYQLVGPLNDITVTNFELMDQGSITIEVVKSGTATTPSTGNKPGVPTSAATQVGFWAATAGVAASALALFKRKKK